MLDGQPKNDERREDEQRGAGEAEVGITGGHRSHVSIRGRRDGRRLVVGGNDRFKLSQAVQGEVPSAGQQPLRRPPMDIGGERDLMGVHAMVDEVRAQTVDEGFGSHAPYLRQNANFARPEFASERDRVLARIRQNADMESEEQTERDRLQTALRAFFEGEKAKGTIRSVLAWTKAAGLAHNTLNEVIKNKKNKRLDEPSYLKAAEGATILTGRRVTVEELKGEDESSSSVRPDIAAIIRDLDYISEVDPNLKDRLLEMIRQTAELARKTRERD